MSEDRHDDPDFVLGAVLAQLEDLTIPERFWVLGEALRATVEASGGTS